MPCHMVAQVALDGTSLHFDKPYSYRITPETQHVRVGCRVLVPFGRGNTPRQGLVMGLSREESSVKLKSITSVLDAEPLLNEEMLRLAVWLKERTFCTLFDAVRTMLPTGLYLRIKPVYGKGNPADVVLEQLNDAEFAVWKAVCAAPDGIRQDLLMKRFGLTDDVLLSSLTERGVLSRRTDAFRSVGDATQRQYRIAVDEATLSEVISSTTSKQRAVLELLRDAGCACVKEISYFTGVTAAVINTLANKGLIEGIDVEVSRAAAVSAVATASAPALNAEQATAYETLLQKYQLHTAAGALLYGVTGSGKTQVYMQLIDRVLEDGRQVLVLVPEISLTPQMQRIFLERFGDRVAIMHSALPMGQRMDEWKRIRRGEARIVVGTRLAVFAPCEDLGLIVMDEEQEHSYKSENAPRYHARDVARFRAAHHNALLVLTSATPSLESFHLAQSGRYAYASLNSRFGGAELPQVELVDMRQEEMAENTAVSPTLRAAIEQCLADDRQAILLHNRRGFHTNISCRNCGTVQTCPHCSISMTYHRANGRMMCHYCGCTQPLLKVCPRCGSDKIRMMGMGIQRVEEELAALFPQASVLRMDTDTAASRLSYERYFSDFSQGKYDILVGTQMVAKGLDFPRVGLVGVLSADQALFGDDYRSFETAFDLLTQVVGRAGRRDAPGRAIIQTYVPDHYVIDLAAKQDYISFYTSEIAMRRSMKYPPFSDLIQFGFIGNSEQAVQNGALRFLQMLRTTSSGQYADIPLIALDPMPAVIFKMAGRFRYKLLVKTVNNHRARDMVRQLIDAFSQTPEGKRVTVFADINPGSML